MIGTRNAPARCELTRFAMRPAARLSTVLAATLLFLMGMLCPWGAAALPNCGTTTQPVTVGNGGCDVLFGLARQYDSSSNQPSVAMNANGLIVEVHKAALGTRLLYQIGRLYGASVAWGPRQDIYLNGYWPTVAMTKDGHVLLVFSDSKYRAKSELYYWVGKLDPNGGHDQSITWVLPHDLHWDGGFHSSIAINDAGVIIGVHESNSSSTTDHKLYYRRGHFNSDYTIAWDSGHNGQNYDSGINPHIVINNRGDVVEVHQTSTNNYLHYRRGTITPTGISFRGSQRYNSDGFEPAVALTNNGIVVEVHERGAENYMLRTMGKLNASNPEVINFGSTDSFDTGVYPALATNGAWILQSHEGSLSNNVFFSTSALRDRSNWMADSLSKFGSNALNSLVLPSTVNSGMYVPAAGSKDLGKTQDVDVYRQLQSGIRYLDFRVAAGSPQRIYNGYAEDALGRRYRVLGPNVGDVLDQINRFMGEDHREAVVVKFSDFADFEPCRNGYSAAYDQLVNSITSKLGNYLYTQGDSYPARVPLRDLLSTGGKVIVVVDGSWATSACQQQAGIFPYANYEVTKSAAEAGRFNVFDQPTNSNNYNTIANDQLGKLNRYTGKMENAPDVPCDLFLLNWNTNARAQVDSQAGEIDANLGNRMNSVGKNQYGKFPNVVAVQWVGHSRVTDVSIVMMERFSPSAP